MIWINTKTGELIAKFGRAPKAWYKEDSEWERVCDLRANKYNTYILPLWSKKQQKYKAIQISYKDWGWHLMPFWKAKTVEEYEFYRNLWIKLEYLMPTQVEKEQFLFGRRTEEKRKIIKQKILEQPDKYLPYWFYNKEYQWAKDSIKELEAFLKTEFNFTEEDFKLIEERRRVDLL